jgi:hypothetical protein
MKNKEKENLDSNFCWEKILKFKSLIFFGSFIGFLGNLIFLNF